MYFLYGKCKTTENIEKFMFCVDVNILACSFEECLMANFTYFFLITFVFRVIFDMISRVIVYNNRHIIKLQLKRKKLGKLEHGWFFSNFDFLINRWAETVCLTHESQVEFTLLQVYAFNIPIEVTFTRESIFTFIACDIFLKNHYVLFCNAL